MNQANYDLIVDTCKANGLLRNEAAYVLATAALETNYSFNPVKESYYLGEPKAERHRKSLRYYPWYGRGFVQLTWEENYEKAGKKIGVDLIADPDAALVPVNAAKILVLGMKEGWFTGKKLADYFSLKSSAYVGARRIVNGLDRADDIAALARKYEKDLIAAGYGVDPAPGAVEPEVPAPNWFLALLKIVIDFIVSLLPRRAE